MLLYLVRHGEPDYATDRLTETGWRQARLVSERLAVSGIDEIHSSPMGRARETAQPSADRFGLPVIIEPWAYELGEETVTTFPDGVRKGISMLPTTYLTQPDFRKLDSETSVKQVDGLLETEFPARYRELSEGFDGFLAKLGYERDEEGFYVAAAPSDRHVALFCHAAMMRVLLSRALNVPFLYVCATLVTNFTGITILNFAAYHTEEKRFTPSILSYGDVGHLFVNGERQNHYWTGKPF